MFARNNRRNVFAIPGLFPLLVLLAVTIGACGDAPINSNSSSLDSFVHSMAEETGLSISDLSVPFEQLTVAPGQLQRIDELLKSGADGIYVMQYSDDTLRQIRHIFVINAAERAYVKLSKTPGSETTRQQHDIRSSRYDEQSESLVLETDAGIIRLTAQDVTPVGA